MVVKTASETLPKRKTGKRKGNKIPPDRRRLYRRRRKISNRIRMTRSREALERLRVELEGVEAKISENIVINIFERVSMDSELSFS